MVEKTKSKSQVTRIKASDTPAKSKKAAPKVRKTKKTPRILIPFVKLGGYFKGAWRELREVRWPTRRATWALTIAVIVFSALLTAVILLLDALFKVLFEMIIK